MLCDTLTVVVENLDGKLVGTEAILYFGNETIPFIVKEISTLQCFVNIAPSFDIYAEANDNISSIYTIQVTIPPPPEGPVPQIVFPGEVIFEKFECIHTKNVDVSTPLKVEYIVVTCDTQHYNISLYTPVSISIQPYIDGVNNIVDCPAGIITNLGVSCTKSIDIVYEGKLFTYSV
jgi:hypothetical protein